MKNWKKVILGVALSFMVFFTAIGYAALTDELTISGTLNASAPNEIFITNITVYESTTTTATITGLTSMSTTISGKAGDTIIYGITVKNNTDRTYVYNGTDVDPELTAWTGDKDNQTNLYEITNAYVSGEQIEADGKKTIFIQYTLPKDFDNETVSVNFKFAEPVYTITYINNGETLDVRYALYYNVPVDTANSTAKALVDAYVAKEYPGGNVLFDPEAWMNAGSTIKDFVSFENEEDVADVVLYPKLTNLYTAMFLNQDGSLLDWTFFTADAGGKTTIQNMATEIENRTDEETKIPVTEDLTFDYWEVHVTDEDGNTTTTASLAEYLSGNTAPANDISIYPVYKYNGDVQLIPVDKDGNGTTDEYQVGGYNNTDAPTALVEIPSSVNGVPVTSINDGAFNAYDDLTAVKIPGSIGSIGSKVFSNSTYSRQTVTIYYEGDPGEFREYMDVFYVSDDQYADRNGYKYTSGETIFTDNWDSGMGDGSRIFFLKDGKVDTSAGYWELCIKDYQNRLGGFYNNAIIPEYIWVYHSHAYPIAEEVSGGKHTYTTADGTSQLCTEPGGDALFHFSTWTNYAEGRVDSGYWTDAATTSTFGLRETLPEDETTP